MWFVGYPLIQKEQIRISLIKKSKSEWVSGGEHPPVRKPGRVWRPLVGQPFRGIGIVWFVGYPFVQKEQIRINLIKKAKSAWVSGGQHPPSAILDCPGRLAKGFQGGSGGLL